MSTPAYHVRMHDYMLKHQQVEMNERWSFVDLLWQLRPVPVGTPYSIPALGSPRPWYILPAALCPMPNSPWDRKPNGRTARLERIRKQSLELAQSFERAEAARPKEPEELAEAKTAANRKKRERKKRSQARKKAAEGGDGADAGSDVEEELVSEGVRESQQRQQEQQREPSPPEPPAEAYALPPHLHPTLHEHFLQQYANMHREYEKSRNTSEKFIPGVAARRGHAYIFPREHDPPKSAASINPNNGTFILLAEL
ncbi:hypothetical protein JCM10908_007216 [Rhodotorula pacifica]|uniref:uncharacterized protein n=1 Tax=Rhodotorula pacifica TaxID=1495444 RepID=UPI0031750F1E